MHKKNGYRYRRGSGCRPLSWRTPRLRSFVLFGAISVWLGVFAPASAVTISEIHYNPAGPEESLEFIELTNDSSTPEDLSGYSFVEGVHFTFGFPTILPARGSLVVCSDVDLVESVYGIDNAVGNFVGRLDNGGERLTLVNQSGIVVHSLSYNDSGKWPAGADGTGHSLSIRSVHLDPGEPESWVPSIQLGGTPGGLNFPEGDGPIVIDDVILPAAAVWRYAKGTAAFSSPALDWTTVSFDDSSWLQGAVGIGYGDNDDLTPLADMQNNYVSVAARKTFELSAADLGANGRLGLAIDYDDGFCAYLNGQEVAKVNCGEPQVPLPFDQVATGSREAGAEEFFPFPTNLSVEGTNTLAIVGHNVSSGSSDFSLNPRVIRRTISSLDNDLGGLPIVFNELERDPVTDTGWVELYNDGAGAIDLAGFSLADNPDGARAHVFPAATQLGAGEFLVVSQGAGPFLFGLEKVRLFLRDQQGSMVAAATFNRLPFDDDPTGDLLAGFVEVRFPDGAERLSVSNLPTPGAANDLARDDCLVINEIFYSPPLERAGEFVELVNRCDEAVDISGYRFSKGIEFTFPAGTIAGPGAYVVVALEPQVLIDNYGSTDVHGPFEGQLSNRGENLRILDRLDNLVDEVRYADGGDWPQEADGGGSSLELVDPWQDNDFPAAWAASDERDKAVWEELSFTVPSYRPASQSELHLYLIERGVCLIDDVAIRRSGGTNLIPNSDFEASTSGWLIDGTHIRSQRVTYDAHSGGACLEMNASGKGDTIINRLEIETVPRMTTGSYDVSLWAKWQGGGNLLVAHGEYTSGSFPVPHSPSSNLGGNSMAASLRMTIPLDVGSPGATNSVRALLLAADPLGNSGPVIGDVGHQPIIPTPNSEVTINARVADSDGVESVAAMYRVGSALGEFQSVEMFDDGQHGDDKSGDGLYGGFLPGQSVRTRVVYFVEAVDSRGSVGRFPVEAPDRTLLWMADTYTANRLHTYSLFLDTARSSELSSRHKHSNDLLDGAFVFNDSENFYNVGVRHRGSPWGRSSTNLRIKFPGDRPFHRGRREINISSRAGTGLEAAAYFLVGRASSPSTPAPTADYLYNRTKFNGGSAATRAMIQPVDSDYHRRWYGDTDGGLALKAVGRLQFDDAGVNWSWEGAAYGNRGTNVENYRGYYRHVMRQGADEWDSFIQLNGVMARASTAGFEREIAEILDVEAYLRVLAPNILLNGWDQYAVGNGHNGYMVFDPVNRQWELLPFDIDNSFSGSPTLNIFTSREPNVARMLGRPSIRRLYSQIVYDYANDYWSVAGARPLLDQLTRDTGVGTSSVINWLNGSSNHIRNSTRSVVQAPFRILTNGGADFETEALSIELTGEAPATAAIILVTRSGREVGALDPDWTSPTRWRVELELPEHRNAFELVGFSEVDEVVGSASLVVTATSIPPAPELSSWEPQRGPSTGGTVVTFVGSRFDNVTRVSFGGVPAEAFEVMSADLMTAVAPPASEPLPPDGLVEIELDIEVGLSVITPAAFQYEPIGFFLRGDGNDNERVEIGDAFAVLLHAFRGQPLDCLDAGDANDDGSVDSADAVTILDFLFLSGPPPAPPFPNSGTDATADELPDCE